GVPIEMAGDVCEQKKEHNTVKVVGFSDARESVVLARAVAELRARDGNVKLKFVGKVPSVRPEIEKTLEEGVVFVGPVNHRMAVEEISSAGVLVAVLSKNRSRVPAISSKLFEYLAVATPVIVLNPTRSDRTLFARYAGVWMLSDPTK